MLFIYFVCDTILSTIKVPHLWNILCVIRNMACDLMMTGADLCGAIKNWPVHRTHVTHIYDEFYLQVKQDFSWNKLKIVFYIVLFSIFWACFIRKPVEYSIKIYFSMSHQKQTIEKLYFVIKNILSSLLQKINYKRQE